MGLGKGVARVQNFIVCSRNRLRHYLSFRGAQPVRRRRADMRFVGIASDITCPFEGPSSGEQSQATNMEFLVLPKPGWIAPPTFLIKLSPQNQPQSHTSIS